VAITAAVFFFGGLASLLLPKSLTVSAVAMVRLPGHASPVTITEHSVPSRAVPVHHCRPQQVRREDPAI